MTCSDLAVDAVLIVGTVGSERDDRVDYLIEQSANRQGIVHVAGGQRRRGDLPGVGIHGDVQLAPGPPCLRAVLLEQPFATAAQLQPGAVHQQVHGPELGCGRITSRLAAWWLRVVWSGTARSRPSRAMMEPTSPSV